MKALLAATALSFSSLLVVGCAADTSSPDSGFADSSEDLSSSKPLSHGLICAAVKTAMDNQNDPSGLTSVPKSDLKGAALHDFSEWQRNMVPDYPSNAYKLPVTLGTKTYTFLLVLESNDGGGGIGVYRMDGRVVATDLYSESEDNGWSKPADTCPTE